jgi:hypothetical protein
MVPFNSYVLRSPLRQGPNYSTVTSCVRVVRTLRAVLSAVVHQSGSSIITRAGIATVSAGWKIGSERRSGYIESHEDRADD